MDIELPDGDMSNVIGYSDKEVAEYTALARRHTNTIFHYVDEETLSKEKDTFYGT